eukprot:1958306-Rhodomonas_salina.1
MTGQGGSGAGGLSSFLCMLHPRSWASQAIRGSESYQTLPPRTNSAIQFISITLVILPTRNAHPRQAHKQSGENPWQILTHQNRVPGIAHVHPEC